MSPARHRATNIILIINVLKAVASLIIPNRSTTALCECSFSSLRPLKAYMRSNLGHKKLNLVMLASHYYIILSNIHIIYLVLNTYIKDMINKYLFV